MGFKQLEQADPVEFGKEFVSFLSSDSGERIDLQYYHDFKSQIVYALVRFGYKAQGPPAHAHGGAISSVFDELMGACCWVQGYPAMTAQYTTRFFKPLPLNREVLFQARISELEGSKISLRAQVSDGEDICYAEAKGLFILQNMETFKKMSQLDNNTLKQFQGLEKQTSNRKE